MPNQEETIEVLNRQEAMGHKVVITEVMNRQGARLHKVVAIIEAILLKEIPLQEKCQVREAIQVAETKVVPEEMAEQTEEVRLNKYRF
jgi:hypothetical protein